MKFITIVTFLVFSFFFFSSAQGQNTFQNAGAKNTKIVYQSPLNGDNYVSQKAPILIRLPQEMVSTHTLKDFSFIVRGQSSGVHLGKVVTSGDNQLVIFKPDLPFALDENVSVQFTILNAENFEPVSYSFYTTSVSETERGLALYTLRQREQSEFAEALKESSENTQSSSLPFGTDTIAGLPIVGVIDTVTTHYPENIFFSPTGSTPGFYSFLSIISDTSTSALFVRNIPNGTGNFRMQQDGTLSYFRQYSAPTLGVFDGVIDHLDKNMNLIDTFECVGYLADLHDFQILPNGHALLVAYDPQRINMDSLYPGKGYRKNSLVFGAIIQELDNQKNLVYQWRSWDHFQITDATKDIKLGDSLVDYMHINTAIMDPVDGNIIASFRHCDEVSKISHTDTSFIWRWGGKHNQFTFVGDTLQFSHQHDPARIKNGHITLFDNGNLHTKLINGIDSTVPSTRALEYALDEVNHTATVVWQYDSLPVCLAAGNVQRLDNGNTMIGCGIVAQPSAIEVDPSGQKVFEFSLQKGAFSYRTYRFPFNPPSLVRPIGNANSFHLTGIYPNPAQNFATVNFSISKPGLVQIELIDVLGHAARTLTEMLSDSGEYSADFDVRDLHEGIYFCRLSQNEQSVQKTVIIQK